MITIYKYELKLTDEQTFELPMNARILSVANQNGKLVLWAVVNTEHRKTNRTIKIIGTGNPTTDELFVYSYDAPSGYALTHLGTVQMDNGLVWHVFTR